SGLVAFSFFPKKPSLNLRSKDNLQLLLSPYALLTLFINFCFM
ncbi:hypothetical protein LEP1GSC008_0906, partial [Leptospira kirschneri serovar Bulgarica str. Nikolaevo]